MQAFSKSLSATVLAALALAGSALAQTCLDHDFSDDTEFYIQSTADVMAYRNFALDRQGGNTTYWTHDVKQLIDELRAGTSEWREAAGWPSSAITIKLTDGGYQCDSAIEGDDLYTQAASSSGVYVRTLGRSERNQIMNRLNEISRMSIQ